MSGTRWNGVWREMRRLLLLVAGTLVASLGFSLFQEPYDLAAGGVSGIGIIVAHFTGFSASWFYLLANIPLLIIGYFALGGWRFLYRTILSVLIFTFATQFLTTQLPAYVDQWPVADTLLLSAIYAGLIGGIGGGMIYAAGGTMGGTAIIGRIIQVRTGIPLSQIYLFVDGAIVITAGLVFGWATALYAYLSLLLAGLATDYVLEGPSRTRTATIITTKPGPMIDAIIDELGRGVSYWDATGGFSHEKRTVLLCTFYRPQEGDLKRIIAEVDPGAFVNIGITQQAMGQGFTEIQKSIG